jgi:hypothetical protein
MEEGYPASAATQHKLSTKWVLWFDYPVKGFAIFFFSFFFFFFSHFTLQAPQAKKRTVWENNLRKVWLVQTWLCVKLNEKQVATIETLEDFWGVMNKVAPAGKVRIFCFVSRFPDIYVWISFQSAVIIICFARGLSPSGRTRPTKVEGNGFMLSQNSSNSNSEKLIVLGLQRVLLRLASNWSLQMM